MNVLAAALPLGGSAAVDRGAFEGRHQDLGRAELGERHANAAVCCRASSTERKPTVAVRVARTAVWAPSALRRRIYRAHHGFELHVTGLMSKRPAARFVCVGRR